MQRLHYERPHMRGSVMPGPLILSGVANLLGWALFLLPLYVWYQVGLGPALALLVITFLVPLAFSTVELFLFRVPTAAMALISTPIAIIAFVMAIRAALRL